MESTDNPETEKCRLRQGALDTLIKIKSKEIFQNTISDGHLGNLKNNLIEAGIAYWEDHFFDLYHMEPGQQKDILNMLNFYEESLGLRFKPENVLVVGDDYDIDIALAKKQGCQTLHVPEEQDGKRISLNVNKIYEILDLK